MVFLMSEVKAQSLPDLYGKAMFVQACQKDQGQKIVADETLTAGRKIELLKGRAKGCDCLYGRAVAGGVGQEQMLKLVSELNGQVKVESSEQEPALIKMMTDPRFGGACGLIPTQQ